MSDDATLNVKTIRLWEGKAPLAQGEKPTDVPDITIYRAKEPDGSVVVVCPGGGYGHLANHEGEPVARLLNTVGITGIVLKYRLNPPYHHPAPLADVSRAIRTVRAKAKEWELDPKRVGVLGFSAGGHLAATVSNWFDRDDRDAKDPIDQQSSRPDVSVLCYPVITFGEVSAHVGSRKALLGENPDPALVKALSLETQVTPHTPPTFLFHTVTDQAVPVENSLMYATALRKAGVLFELHLFEKGRHGVGLAQTDPALREWPKLCLNWLALQGFGRAIAVPTSGPVTTRST